MTAPKSDRELIVEVLKGDTRAFEPLVQRYQSLVASVILRIVQDQEAVRDLTQDCFVKAYRNIKSYQLDRPFKTWLLTIANNSAIDYLRAKKPALSLESLLEDEPHLEPGQSAQSESQLETELTMEELARALDQIPVRYRQAFILRYQFDLSYQDIAQVMHESEANVRNLLFRAKSSLRKLIADSALGLYQSEGIQL